MSQLEVDKIIPQSGTTLTIGDSGDTISFAEGTNLGIDTNTLVIDSTNNRVGIKNASPTVELDVTGDVKVAGDISLGDSDKIILGTGNDIQLYHDGANSYFTGGNVGAFYIRGGTSGQGALNLTDASGGYRFLVGNDGGATEIYHNATNALKLATTSTGANIYNQGTNHVELELITDAINDRSSGIKFSDSSGGNVRSIIQSNHYDNSLRFYHNSGTSERMRIDSSGNVGIGTSSPSQKLHIVGSQLLSSPGSSVFTYFDSTSNYIGRNASTGNMEFGVAGSERMRIKSDRLLVSSSGNDIGGSNVGGQIETAGTVSFNRSNFVTMFVQRRDSDGSLVDFQQDGVTEGSISVSGATVSYNGFTGTHWSRLADNSKPTILKGTILESLDEMMDWYQVHFTIQEEGKDDVQMEKSYVLQEGESVGDVITYNHEGTDYQATIVKESDVKHSKAKVSDTSESKAVYGVFVDWDNDDDTVNDMYVAQTGTFVVRMNSAETVSKGDLIQSNGDGTGKVQADDIIRSSTVAKVLSTTKIETYDDGSYIVPCSLHC